MDASLRPSLHSAPGFSVALKARRAAPGHVWLEQASIFGRHEGSPGECCRLRLSSAVSPLPVSITLADCSGEGTGGARAGVFRVESSSDLPPSPRVSCSALEEVAYLCKSLAADGCAAAWPPEARFGSALLRAALIRETTEASSTMARLWGSLGGTPFCVDPSEAAVAAVVEGFAVSALLLNIAAVSPRAPVVCEPLPPCFLSGASRRAFGARAALAQRPWSADGASFDAAALGVAMQGVAAVLRASLAGGTHETAPGAIPPAKPSETSGEAPSLRGPPAPGRTDSEGCVRVLSCALQAAPVETLLLLHWLAVLAPVFLLPPPGGAGGAGAPSLRVLGGSGGSALRRYSLHAGLPLVGRGSPAAAVLAEPLWDRAALETHGLVTVPPPPLAASGLTGTALTGPPAAAPLLHGTPTENAFRIIQGGLRSQSGTRHEASGAMVRRAVLWLC